MKLAKKNNILIVDDDKKIRSIVKTMLTDKLQDKYIAFVESEDGINAMVKTGNQKFDLIITDLNMPKKHGRSFIEDVLTQKRISPDRILVISGSINQEDLIALTKLGVKNIILKPFSEEQLIAKVSTMLN